MIKNDQVYLEHIIEAIGKIEDFTEGISRFDFDGNVMIQDAVIRNIEIIGEATKKISKSFTQFHQEIPWSEMAGMRDKLIHAYFGMDTETIWETVHKNIPTLKHTIQKLLKDQEKE